MTKGTIDTLGEKLTELAIDNVAEVLEYFIHNLRVFEYAKRRINDFSVFLVQKNVGNNIMFKTVKGLVVCDKLDIAYSNSRELIGLESWNVKRVIKINVIDKDTYHIKLLSLKDIQKLAFNTVEPSSIDYVIWYKDNFLKLSLDEEILKGMSFETLVEAIDAVLKKKSLPKLDVASKHLNCYVVDFYKDECFECSG